MPVAVSIENMEAAVGRELAFRARIYPRWIRQGKIRPDQAAQEQERFRAVLEALEELRRHRAFRHELERTDMVWLRSAPFSLVAVPFTDAQGASLRGAWEALTGPRDAPLTMGTHERAPSPS